MRKVLILDTSILCVWLEVPGMADCGPIDDKWDRQRVADKIAAEEQETTTFVLPLASIIETGNHIAQAVHSRRERGGSLADLMKKSANQETPWAAFSEQSVLWSPEKLVALAESGCTKAFPRRCHHQGCGRILCPNGLSGRNPHW